MDVVITGRNINMTEKLEDYIEMKIDKLERHMPDIGEVRVELAEVKAKNAENRQVAQVTVHGLRGTILRAEEHSSDIMLAVDAATDKLHRQIERYRGKRERSRKQRRNDSYEWKNSQLDAYQSDDEYEDDGREVVRRKTFPVTPMNEEEAIEQLDMLGHDFFLYYNADTAIVNLVYRRKDGDYGILEPELS